MKRILAGAAGALAILGVDMAEAGPKGGGGRKGPGGDNAVSQSRESLQALWARSRAQGGYPTPFDALFGREAGPLVAERAGPITGDLPGSSTGDRIFR